VTHPQVAKHQLQACSNRSPCGNRSPSGYGKTCKPSSHS
jgi:hypothetical protein